VYKNSQSRRLLVFSVRKGVLMDAATGPEDLLHHDAQKPRRTPQSCRWGQSTLYLTYPDWLLAWDMPWTCSHPAHKGPLETVETCTTCPHWTPADRDQH
jgi:hypothetical protein